MDLKQLFQATIDALDKREADLVRKSQALTDYETELQSAANTIDEEKRQLESDRKAVSDVQDVKAQAAYNDERSKALDQREIALSNKEIELKKYENTLAEIKSHQTAKEEELRKAGVAQAEREATYKDKIREEFYAEVKAKLPQ